MKIDNELIISYLSNELNKEDKAAFELELLENKELRLIIDDLSANDLILQNMPKHKTSTDFMIGLNAKIEAYEKSNIPWYNRKDNSCRHMVHNILLLHHYFLIMLQFCNIKKLMF